MEQRNKKATLEQCERDAVGAEVTDQLHGVLMYVDAVGTTDDGFRPQFADYVVHELTRLMAEITDYRRYLATKPRRDERRQALFEKRRRLRALGSSFLKEKKKVDAELAAMSKEERRVRFPYLKKKNDFN